MKKKYCISLFIIITICTFIVSCKEQPTPDISVGMTADEVIVSSEMPIESGKWPNADTLQITAEGSINEESFSMSSLKRREMACNAAKLTAMNIAVDILGDADSQSVTDVQKETVNGVQRFSAFIRGGSVLKSTFDNETNKCTVVYELKEKNLKKKALSGRS